MTLLELEARAVLRKYKPKVVAITGSVGKTSTKDAIFAVLDKIYYTHASHQSYNSEIGVPLTILDCPNAWDNPLAWVSNLWQGLRLIFLKNIYPQWLVLEVGADRPGDIKHITSYLSADLVVITRMSSIPVHVEFFPSPEQVAVEKAQLLQALRSGGVVALNADDEITMKMAAKSHSKVITFGFSESAQVRASELHIMYKDGHPEGMAFRIDYAGNSVPIRLRGAFGKSHVYAILAASAVGIAQEINLVKIADAFSNYTTPPGRMHLLEGINNSLIVDDSYNSSPIAAEVALHALEETQVVGRKIAVLGDMMELGKFTPEAHREIGRHAARVVNLLVAVGLRAKFFLDGASSSRISKKKMIHFDTAATAGQYLKDILQSGDLVLVKGSQAVRLEKTVAQIMAHPKDASKLLVRQDPEWQNR